MNLLVFGDPTGTGSWPRTPMCMGSRPATDVVRFARGVAHKNHPIAVLGSGAGTSLNTVRFSEG